MFRIKTDIRQYKCESREKVERLIRNWVVRPTDLIFYDDKQEWGPIGEHSEFVSTFAELAKREAEAPDTIVSSEPPANVDGDDQPGEELDPPEPPEGVEPQEAEPDEITVMTEDTLEDLMQGEGDGGEGEISVVETREGETESDQGEAEDTDLTGDAPTNPEVQPPSEIEAPADPEAPTEPEDMRPGPEERTAVASDPSETAVAGGTAEPDEPTNPQIPESETPDDSTDPEATPGPPSREVVRPEGDPADVTLPDPDAVGDEPVGPHDETLPPEAGDEQGDSLRDTDEMDEESESSDASRNHSSGALESGVEQSEYEISGEVRTDRDEGGMGRHNLPEEIFATNEIREDSKDVDSLSAYRAEHVEQGEDSVDYEQVEEALQKNARAARQDHVDDEWDEILQRLRETDELSNEEIEEITKTRDQIAIGRDEGGDTPVGEEVPEEIEEYVSEGYDRELPIPIGPTRRDVQLGLHRSRASEADKDRVFPYPGPKREGRVIRQAFILRPPRDHSIVVIAGVIGLVVFLIGAAVYVF